MIWIDANEAGPDSREVAGAVAVREAARAVDSPYQPPMDTTRYRARLRYGWDGDAPIAALARDARGRPVGLLELWFPHWDNTHSALADLTVDPAARRQGIGRRLFELAVERTAAERRTQIIISGPDQAASAAFAKAMGLEAALTSIERRQDLSTLDWDQLDREYAEAERLAADYELIRIAGETPADWLPAVATMTAAINDAPIGALNIEDEVFTPERIRMFETAQLARNLRLYRVIARHRETGELAGHTVVAVERERPWHGWQYDTSVLRAHRGHRLGLLVKLAMMYWLGTEEPQLRIIDTDNAESNAHMIRVNELLGYQVVGAANEWQKSI
jgi:GNAT superfamily N-acetyltransferase